MAGFNEGQSLIELIIAVAIGAVIILVGVAAVSVSLRIASQDPLWQTGNFLTQQLLDNVAVTAEGNWSAIAAATTTSHLVGSDKGFVVVEGAATVIIDNVSYLQSFFATSTRRNASGDIDPNGTDDPSTKRAVVRVEWVYRNQPVILEVERYLGRTRNAVFAQTDWLGGPTCPASDPAVTSPVHNKFCESAAELEFEKIPGSIIIKGF